MNLFSKIKSSYQSLKQKKLLNHIFWLTTENFISGINGIVFLLVARKIEPAEFGKLGFAYSIAAVLIIIINLGLDKILTRYLITNPKEGIKMLINAYFIQIIVFLFILFLFVIINIYYNNELTLLISVICILSGISSILSLGALELDATKNFKLRVISRSIGHSFSIISRLILIWLGFGIFALGIIKPIALIITFSFCTYFSYKIISKRISDKIELKVSSKKIKKLLLESFPLIISSLLFACYMHIDKIMLYALTTESETGKYFASFRILGFLAFLPLMIAAIYYPSLGKRIYKKNYFNKLELYFSVTNFVTLSASILGVFIIPFAIPLILGDKYQESIHIFKILIWTLLFIGMSVSRDQHLNLMSQQKYIPVITLLSFILNIILNLTFIPNHGGVGAAYATLITAIFSGLISSIFFKDLRSLFIIEIKSFNFFKNLNKI